MSESDEHKLLVELMANKLASDHEGIDLYADLHRYPSVPNIYGWHPDVYGFQSQTNREFICEAKTFGDLESIRSKEQIASFLHYLEAGNGNVFMIGGIGRTAQRAKTMLRFHQQVSRFSLCSLRVFDGCDYWELESENGRIWHLL